MSRARDLANSADNDISGTLTVDDITLSGNITVGGTVDGRDLATDGSKLDGVEAGADVTDVTNVTAAGALMESAVTNLTQVKAFDSSDYATAAQGATADAALPKSGGTMTGSVSFAAGQTFDGRDLSADGSKLDGIESGATGDQSAAEIKTAYESNSNTNAYTDTEKTKLSGIETGATADQTKADIDALNINADTLDGQHGSYYTGYADTAVANLVDSAPGTLDTLNELAAALGDDPNFSTTVTNNIATKLPLAGGTMTGAITFASGQTFDGRDVSADGAKLDGIESGATADQTASEILTAIKTVDGSGSGLDADTLDGVQGSSYLRSDAADTTTGKLTINTGTSTTGLDMSTHNAWADIRVIQNTSTVSGNNDGMYVGYGNSNSGQTRIMGGGATSGGISVNGSGVNDVYIAGNKVWNAGNDGSGSGLDADLWNGNQFSSYLNQAVKTDSNPVFNTVYVSDRIFHNGDTDTSIVFGTNEITMQTGGSNEVTVNSTGVRLGDSGNGYFRPVSGSYGSIEIDGGGHGGYEGYSIGGRVVFMHNNSSAWGIYNDVNNQWAILGTLGQETSLQYGGSSKITTTSTGATVTGTLTATGNITAYYSDERLKTKTGDLEGALEKIKQLNGFYYVENDLAKELGFDNDQQQVALSAQEVQAVMPEAVSIAPFDIAKDDETGETLPNVSASGEDYLTVDYARLVPLLVEAIKELKAEIEELKNGSTK